MRFVASVSFVALALAGCAANSAPPAVALAPEAAVAPVAAGEPARTPEGAREFIAAVEKDFAEFSVIAGRAAWVNSTYINDDTDALNAYFGTIGTEKGVKYATEAAKWLQVPGLELAMAYVTNRMSETDRSGPTEIAAEEASARLSY